MFPEGPRRHSLQHITYSHLFSATPYELGQGKVGSMCGELTPTSSLDSDRDSNRQPDDYRARTLTTASSSYPHAEYSTVTQLRKWSLILFNDQGVRMTNSLLACPWQTPCTMRTKLCTHLLFDINNIHGLLLNVTKHSPSKIFWWHSATNKSMLYAPSFRTDECLHQACNGQYRKL